MLKSIPLALVLTAGVCAADYASLGLVDVTAEPFRADPTGERDSTESLQRAIDFARGRRMVAFFPTGTYRVSDTIHCIQDGMTQEAIRDRCRPDNGV